MYNQRLSAYRIMWIFILYDLPTETALQRKQFQQFQKKLLKLGYMMFQFSVYMRHCASAESAAVHIKRLKSILPPEGSICIFKITDKQFGAIETFYNTKPSAMPDSPGQLQMF